MEFMFSLDHSKFVLEYKKIYKTSKSWLFVLFFLFCVFVGGYFISVFFETKSTHALNVFSSFQFDIIKTSFERLGDVQGLDGMDIYLIFGDFVKTENGYNSNSNLIQHNDRTLPRNVRYVEDMQVMDIVDFQSEDYDIDDMMKILSFFMQSHVRTDNISRHKLMSIPGNDILDFFGISCVDYILRSPVCNYFLNYFLDSFYVMDISAFVDDIKDLVGKLNRRQKDKLCAGILKYLSYSFVFDDEYDSIFAGCSDGLRAKYVLSKSFFEINEEIKNNSISNKVYNDRKLNEYKLISIMQILSNDIQNNLINIRRIEGYMSFVNNLLINKNVRNIYLDMLYVFLNSQMMPYIAENIQVNSYYVSLYNQLMALNNPNRLLGHNGLQDSVLNRSIIVDYDSIDIMQNTGIVDGLIRGLDNLVYIEINQKVVDGDDVFIQARMNLSDVLEDVNFVNFDADLLLKNNRIIVRRISIDGFAEFSEILNIFMSSNDLTLPAVYNYVYNNISIYSSDIVHQPCNDLRRLGAFNILECSNEILHASVARRGKVLEYRIIIENNRISRININDVDLQEYIRSRYNGVYVDEILFVSLMSELLTTEISIVEKERTMVDQNILLVNNNFQSFFGVKPLDIVVFNDVYYIEFQINNVVFVMAYDFLNNRAGPLFFKDVLINNRPLVLEDRSVNLNMQDISVINSFVRNPLDYISREYPFVYQMYVNR